MTNLRMKFMMVVLCIAVVHSQPSLTTQNGSPGAPVVDAVESQIIRTPQCSNVICLGGQICSYGNCIVDPCAAVVCPSGYLCDQGTCNPGPCLNCPPGTSCQNYACITIENNPCEMIVCEYGTTCQGGICIVIPIPPPNPPIIPPPCPICYIGQIC